MEWPAAVASGLKGHPELDELAKTGNRADDRIDRFIAGFFACKSNGFLGNSGNFAHAEADTHKLGPKAHYSRDETSQTATATGLGDRFLRARNTGDQGVDLVGRRFLLQEGEDEAHGLACRIRIGTDIGGNTRD